MCGKDYICDDCFADWVLKMKKEIMDDPTSIGINIEQQITDPNKCYECGEITNKFYVTEYLSVKCPICQEDINIYYTIDKVSCHNNDCFWNGNLYK